MNKLLLFLAATAAPAVASPTYLSCVIVTKTEPFPVNLTVDEDNQQVTTVMPKTGFAERLPAAFEPATLTFGNRGLRYVVSRTDLTIARTLTIGDKAWTDQGTCKVEVPPKRAF